MFTYCLNNPCNYADYNGMCSHTAHAPWLGTDCANCVVNYDVPSYSQDNFAICWAVSEIMVEDYYDGKTQSHDAALRDAIQLAVAVNGINEWNQGGYPTNCAAYSKAGLPLIAVGVDSIESLALYLRKNGPMYAVYKANNPNEAGKHGYHMVVITGANAVEGLVYTNNPWGKSGYQTYDQFLNGFLNMKNSNPYKLVCYIPAQGGSL